MKIKSIKTLSPLLYNAFMEEIDNPERMSDLVLAAYDCGLPETAKKMLEKMTANELEFYKDYIKKAPELLPTEPYNAEKEFQHLYRTPEYAKQRGLVDDTQDQDEDIEREHEAEYRAIIAQYAEDEVKEIVATSPQTAAERVEEARKGVAEVQNKYPDLSLAIHEQWNRKELGRKAV